MMMMIMGDKKKKKVRKKEICQIPSIKSIFSVFGLLFKKLNASANRQVHSSLNCYHFVYFPLECSGNESR